MGTLNRKCTSLYRPNQSVPYRVQLFRINRCILQAGLTRTLSQLGDSLTVVLDSLRINVAALMTLE